MKGTERDEGETRKTTRFLTERDGQKLTYSPSPKTLGSRSIAAENNTSKENGSKKKFTVITAITSAGKKEKESKYIYKKEHTSKEEET